VGPRRTLQLSLILAAAMAILLALTGALSPASAAPLAPLTVELAP